MPDSAAEAENQNLKSTGLKTGHYKTSCKKTARLGRRALQKPLQKQELLDALDVASFRSVHANLITFIDKRGNRNDESGFQGSRLHHRAGGGLLNGWLGLD